MAFLHLKCMHLGSVSLTFMRVCRVIYHYSCNQNSAFGVTSLCCFFWFSRCMVTSLRNHLNFQNSFVSDKHQNDFCFCSKLWFSKNPCENMGSCLLFWEKGKTPMNSWRNGFVSIKVCSVCYLHEHKKKKTHDFINRKGSFDRESLVAFWAKLPTKTGIGWKNQEIFAGMIKQG